MDEVAVSPTVGTILMVASVAVLAGIVAYGLQAEDEKTPVQGLPLVRYEDQDRIGVAKAEADQAWEDHAIRSRDAVAGLHFRVGDTPAEASDDTVGTEFVTLAGGPIRASQSIWFCADAPVENVTIDVLDQAGGGVIHSSTFAVIDAC